MEIAEGYYDCVPERSVRKRLTSYTVYMNGQSQFTVYLYDNNPNMISIKEEKDGQSKRYYGNG